MPISSKRIIEYINSRKGDFTIHHIVKELIESTDPVSKKRTKKKKDSKSKNNDRKSITRIEETVQALHSSGLLKKDKKRYQKADSFYAQGSLQVTGRGDGKLITDDGLEIHIKKENTGNGHNRDMVRVQVYDFRRGYLYGRVTGIISRQKERYVARLVRKTKSACIFELLDMPGSVEAATERSQHEPANATSAIIRLTGRTHANLPHCKVESTFPEDTPLLDVTRIILKYSLPQPHGKYRELQNIENSVPSSEYKNRKNYRNLFTVTIDDESAKDFDDAISIEKQLNSIKLYVHIADVSAYVNPGTELDLEAYKRGTSFYLGDTVIPMFPEKISNDLCSLREGVDRLTMSVEMTFDRKGNIKSYSYHRGIINVNHRLTYKNSSELLQSKKRSKLSKSMHLMKELSDTLKEKRMTRGRVDLMLSDSEMVFEKGVLTDITFAKRLPSHLIIEEFMLSANEAVSRFLREHDIPTLYRIHEPISDEKLTALTQFLKGLNIPLKKTDNVGIALQKIVDSVQDREYQQVVNFVILKSFMQAYYGIHPLGHFGLGFKDYTHFTSPIRRYPDLVVHRCLKSVLDRDAPPYTKEQLVEMGEKTSQQERLAQSAERDLIKLKTCRIMAPLVGQKFEAVVSGVVKSGFFVTLKEKPAEGMVPLRTLTDDFYLVNEDDFTVIGKRLGRRFRLGDHVTVRLTSVDITTMRMDFEVL